MFWTVALHYLRAEKAEPATKVGDSISIVEQLHIKIDTLNCNKIDNLMAFFL